MKTGKAKPLEKITLDDALRYPIWVWALDEAHLEGQDETWQKPVVDESDVTTEMLNRFATVTITLRVAGDDRFASGEYDHETRALSSLAVWHDEEWRLIPDVPGVAFPLELEAVPSILGESSVRFSLPSTDADRAVRTKP
jgi:hypothetical protein